MHHKAFTYVDLEISKTPCDSSNVITWWLAVGHGPDALHVQTHVLIVVGVVYNWWYNVSCNCMVIAARCIHMYLCIYYLFIVIHSKKLHS